MVGDIFVLTAHVFLVCFHLNVLGSFSPLGWIHRVLHPAPLFKTGPRFFLNVRTFKFKQTDSYEIDGPHLFEL